jgi:hypothetical protein
MLVRGCARRRRAAGTEHADQAVGRRARCSTKSLKSHYRRNIVAQLRLAGTEIATQSASTPLRRR